MTVPEWRGGRTPGEQVQLVPAGAVDITSERPSAHPTWRAEPWPGQLAAPSPATIATDPMAVEVVDAAGRAGAGQRAGVRVVAAGAA